MKFSYKIFGALLGATALSACAPSEGEWNTARTMVQGSPAMYQQLLAECIRHGEQAPLATRQQAAKLINVNVASVSQVWCSRTARAFKSGRLTYAEMKQAHLGTGDNSKFIKIVQGR